MELEKIVLNAYVNASGQDQPRHLMKNSGGCAPLDMKTAEIGIVLSSE